MVRDALNAVVRRDVDLAQKVLATDDRVDHYRDQIFRELLTYMMGDSSVVFPAFELILVAKNLERIGDHATNIAEDVIYLVQGQDVRHPPSTAADSEQVCSTAFENRKMQFRRRSSVVSARSKVGNQPKSGQLPCCLEPFCSVCQVPFQNTVPGQSLRKTVGARSPDTNRLQRTSHQ